MSNSPSTWSAPTIPDDLVIPESHLQLDPASIVCLSPLSDIYSGMHLGQSVKLKAHRNISYYAQLGIDVDSILIHEALLRREYQTTNHVAIKGIYKAGPTYGSRLYLVEAQHRGTPLKGYLERDNSGCPRFLKQALATLMELHTKGVVLGTIGLDSFEVTPAGKLLLCGFESMRVESTDAPFRPLLNPSLDEMLSMAPELTRSFIFGGRVPLTKATDMFALGCFAYELLTGRAPFSSSHMESRQYITQLQLIADERQLPRRPETGPRFVLSDDAWRVLEGCWSVNPVNRPSAHDLLAALSLP